MKKFSVFLTIAVLAAVMAVVLAACGGGSSSCSSSSSSTSEEPAGGGAAPAEGEGNEGGTLKGAYTSFPDYMDPQISYTAEGWTAMRPVYVPLLTYKAASEEEGAEIIPGLAKELPKVTNGGKTYTMFLRTGLKYSNGEPIKAGDFKYAVERCFLTNSGGSPFYTDIVGAEQFAKTKKGGISGIKTNEKTGEIVINLDQPRGTFNNELALMFVAPVPQNTPDEDQSASPPPASGPYMITKSEPGRGWDYERNPYWAKDNGKQMRNPGRPRRQDRNRSQPQPVDPGQRHRIGQAQLDLRSAPDRPLPGSQRKIRRHPVPAGADDLHLLLLDEPDAGTVQQPESP